jgi:large subunit ribosomal protein L18
MSLTVLSYKRKKSGKTDYRKRLGLLKSGKIRVVVRKALKNILLQAVKYEADGDKVLLSVHSSSLKKYGWELNKGNVPAAYLTGLLFGKMAKEKGIDVGILDNGLCVSVKGSVIYAAVNGAKDSGYEIPCSKEMFPIEEKLNGKSISDDVHKKFLEVKEKIGGGKNDGKE